MTALTNVSFFGYFFDDLCNISIHITTPGDADDGFGAGVSSAQDGGGGEGVGGGECSVGFFIFIYFFRLFAKYSSSLRVAAQNGFETMDQNTANMILHQQRR